jgi:hypothetical protein
MTRWSWAVLVFELLLITIILILPQVDIPDTAFHCGSAPVLAKSRLTNPPAPTQTNAGNRPISQPRAGEAPVATARVEVSNSHPALVTLLSMRRC